MNRIVSFGSSPILHHPRFNKDDLPFPALIAKKLRVDYVTRAKPLSSNTKITRKILTYEFQQGDIAFVSWTSPSRFEFRTEHGWMGINPATYTVENSFGEHWYTGPGQWEYTIISIALKEILIAQTFLNQSNIPYVFVFDNDEIFESHLYYNPDAYLKSLLAAIKWDQVIKFDGHGFMPWATKSDFEFVIEKLGAVGKPGAAAHIAAADYLIEKSPLLQSRVANPNCG